MSGKWFICRNDEVLGPFPSEEVRRRLESAELISSDLIWGAGMAGWQTLQWWSRESPNLSIVPQADDQLEAWHFAIGGKSYGPFQRAQLVQELKVVEALGEVMLWTKGMKEWAHLFEFHDILTDLGVNKRQFPRSELQGQAVIKTDGQTLVAPTLTVSEGGLSIRLDSGLVSGQFATIEIQSPIFHQPLHARCEVRYAANGVVGLRFSNLNSESKGAIVQLMRQNTTRFVLRAA